MGSLARSQSSPKFQRRRCLVTQVSCDTGVLCRRASQWHLLALADSDNCDDQAPFRPRPSNHCHQLEHDCYSEVISSFLKSRPACSKVSTARYAASLSPITSDAAAVAGARRCALLMCHILPSNPSQCASMGAKRATLQARVLLVIAATRVHNAYNLCKRASNLRTFTSWGRCLAPHLLGQEVK
jgi:hypothetical protein